MSGKTRDAKTDTKKAGSPTKEGKERVAVRAFKTGSNEAEKIRQVNAAIRLAEIQIAKGKQTGQGIGSVRKPGGAGKKK